MSKSVLNEDEINDLLENPAESNSGGGLWAGDTNDYDFFGAALQKDEKIQAVNKLHSNAANTAGIVLTRVCDTEIKVEFLKHDMISSSDAIAEINVDENIVFVWNDERAALEGLFRLENNLFVQLYNLLFGGQRQTEKKGHWTPLEKTLFSRIFEPLSETLQSSWKGNGNWRFTLKNHIGEQEVLAGLGWSFDCFRATFKLSIGEEEAGHFICLFPRIMLNAIGDEEGREGADAGARDRYWAEAVRHAISERSLTVSAVLGNIRLPLEEVMKIQQDDTYPLIIPSEGHVVTIDGKPMFRSTIGTVDGNRAIKISGYDLGGDNDE